MYLVSQSIRTQCVTLYMYLFEMKGGLYFLKQKLPVFKCNDFMNIRCTKTWSKICFALRIL